MDHPHVGAMPRLPSWVAEGRSAAAEHVLWRDGVALLRAAAADDAGAGGLRVPVLLPAQLVGAQRAADRQGDDRHLVSPVAQPHPHPVKAAARFADNASQADGHVPLAPTSLEVADMHMH